ncbi:MAG TPA: galactokinase [Chitinophagaceae bacterium]|nr:galactokinase [Chitinophagaceae bacterium]
MNAVASRVNDIFIENFTSTPHLYFSPGRINFIGEHIDYNDGFVMPAAIDKGICYAIALNNTDEINFYSVDFNEKLLINTRGIKKMTGWRNYVLGVVNEFQLLKKEVKGFDCVFGGNIADGAGISSSAAVEGGLAFGINELFNFRLNRKELALLCQRAEHNFPGVMCGIMDQYANMFGKKHHVILLDTRSVEHQYFPLKLEEYEIVLINTKVHHSLASSEYNVRRKECEEGLGILKKEKGINSFRDIKSAEELLPFKNKMGEKVYDRCLYVVEEILRTQEAAKLLQQNNLTEFGRLMFETHKGLSKLYEVSCKELDFLVEKAKENKAVIGARMMGGGFGGCTINIIKKESTEDFLADATGAYRKEFKIDAEVIKVQIGDGTNEILM